MKKRVWLAGLIIYCCLMNLGAASQGSDSMPTKTMITSKQTRPEIFSAGFFDVFNNGQTSASARLLRLYLGEPGKLSIPLSIYSGVSANSFQGLQTVTGNKSNDHLFSQLINPLSGLMNVAIDGMIRIHQRPKKLTLAAITYQGGEKLLSGYRIGLATDPATGKSISFLNGFCAGGFYLQTGAWEKSNSSNVGICWLVARYLSSFTRKRELALLLPDVRDHSISHGYSIGWGIEITNLLNLKLVFYKYVEPPTNEAILPIYQFSFTYALTK